MNKKKVPNEEQSQILITFQEENSERSSRADPQKIVKG